MAVQGADLQLELLQTDMVWDDAPHNAFTDLIRYQDQWYLAFREATSHTYDSPAGSLRVLRSNDGLSWQSAALIEYGTPADDLRDARLTIAPDGRLMLNGALAPSSDYGDRQSYAWFSEDGTNWSSPVAVGEYNWWLWGVERRPTDNKLYGVGYRTDGSPHTTRLYRSDDGEQYEVIVPTLTAHSWSNETALVLRDDGSAVALVRRNGAGGLVGTSSGDLTDWSFQDTGVPIGGPALFELPTGDLIAATRLYDGRQRTSLSRLDPATGTLTEMLELPSGGDTSYPGMVLHDGKLWVSYYSSHEGKAKIYVAQVRPTPIPEPGSALLLAVGLAVAALGRRSDRRTTE
jgi:hypothetical protein